MWTMKLYTVTILIILVLSTEATFRSDRDGLEQRLNHFLRTLSNRRGTQEYQLVQENGGDSSIFGTNGLDTSGNSGKPNGSGTSDGSSGTSGGSSGTSSGSSGTSGGSSGTSGGSSGTSGGSSGTSGGSSGSSIFGGSSSSNQYSGSSSNNNQGASKSLVQDPLRISIFNAADFPVHVKVNYVINGIQQEQDIGSDIQEGQHRSLFMPVTAIYIRVRIQKTVGDRIYITDAQIPKATDAGNLCYLIAHTRANPVYALCPLGYKEMLIAWGIFK